MNRNDINGYETPAQGPQRQEGTCSEETLGVLTVHNFDPP